MAKRRKVADVMANRHFVVYEENGMFFVYHIWRSEGRKHRRIVAKETDMNSVLFDLYDLNTFHDNLLGKEN